MILKDEFGRCGHQSTRLLLGAAAFYSCSQAEADTAMDLALSYGINHVDVAAGYGDAELRLGDWIGRHGRPFFLATKTDERTAERARAQIHSSLERLRVPQVDLIQLHNLTDPKEWEIALGPGGALEAALRAKEEGLVRFIGVTGHGLNVAAMHLKALERFDFDTVLLPYSYLMAQNPDYLADFLKLRQVCQARNVAVQTIKSLVHTPWGEHKPDRNTWYRPLEDQAEIHLSIHWVLGHEGLFVNSAADVHILPRILDAAQRYTSAPSDAEMREQVERLEMRSLFS